MGRGTQGHDRIATCCYCGARSILPSGLPSGPAPGRRQVPLVCHGCGAPVRVIEAMALPRQRPGKPPRRPALPHPAEHSGAHLPKDRPVRRRKGRHRPGLLARLGRAFDDLDDILDIFD